MKHMHVTRTKYPIIMFFFFFNQNFGPLIEHGPHWINFIIFIFISKKNRYYRGLYKTWNKIVSFDVRKKGET